MCVAKCNSISLSVFFLLFSANQALGDIYKCHRADGSVQFSDVVCEGGLAESIALRENSPLDNAIERENIAVYNRRVSRDTRASVTQGPRVILLDDSRTKSRNARVTVQEKQDERRMKSNKSKKHTVHAMSKSKSKHQPMNGI
jgi:hypothetical protein